MTTKKIYLKLLLLLSISIALLPPLVKPIKAGMFDYNEISFSVFYRTTKPERNFPINKKPTLPAKLVADAERYRAFGATIGKSDSNFGFRFDTGAFLGGRRSTFNLQINHRGAISPYIGMSSIENTNRVEIIKRKKNELDGYDALLGVSAGIYNIVKGHAEYSVNNGIWYMGATIHIPIKFVISKQGKYINIDLGK